MASLRIVLQRKENASIIKILLAQEQKFYTDKEDENWTTGMKDMLATKLSPMMTLLQSKNIL